MRGSATAPPRGGWNCSRWKTCANGYCSAAHLERRRYAARRKCGLTTESSWLRSTERTAQRQQMRRRCRDANAIIPPTHNPLGSGSTAMSTDGERSGIDAIPPAIGRSDVIPATAVSTQSRSAAITVVWRSSADRDDDNASQCPPIASDSTATWSSDSHSSIPTGTGPPAVIDSRASSVQRNRGKDTGRQ